MLKKPLFDKHGYPAGETLKAIEKWPHEDGFVELMEFVGKAWNEDYGKVEKEEREGVMVYKFVTGGWSGNESIIEDLERNFVFWSLCWLKSERGGYYEFEVEKKSLMRKNP